MFCDPDSPHRFIASDSCYILRYQGSHLISNPQLSTPRRPGNLLALSPGCLWLVLAAQGAVEVTSQPEKLTFVADHLEAK
jgi:hypothetical protein